MFQVFMCSRVKVFKEFVRQEAKFYLNIMSAFVIFNTKSTN